jgi:hypothetical protein
MSDLGDLSDFLKEGAVSNLDWVNVNERDYREMDTLPKQNLDFAPELEAQWSHEGKDPGVYFVPNRDMAGYPKDPRVPLAPSTMGDLSQLHGPLSSVVTAARQTLMQTDNVSRWQEALLARFDRQTLSNAKTALAEVLGERGLLGRFYVNAADFPACATSKAASEFVRRFAAGAKFVQAKSDCESCTHRMARGNASHCAVFHKQIVQELPLTDEMASRVEAEQAARGVTVKATSDALPVDRIRTAYLQTPVRTASQAFSGQTNSGALIPAERLLRKVANVDQQQAEVDSHKSLPVVAMVRRELLKGRSASEIQHGLRLAFDPRDLKASAKYWVPLFKEAGLYGTIYSTQDSFDDCRTGADFLSKHSSSVRAIVAGDKCSNCIFAKVNSCMLYGRKLVAKAEDLYTDQVVSAVLDEHRMAGRISSTAANQKWGSTPKESLQTLHRVATTLEKTADENTRLSIQQAFHGDSAQQTTTELTRRAIIKQAKKYLNEGLYGQDLEKAMRSGFDPRDLTAAAADLKLVLAEQGLQGIYYIDPTAYDDYGKGCKEAQRLHRSRQAVKYAKVGSKCTTCVHQTQPGLCSVLNKKLAFEIPYENKVAQQQAVLASGNSTETNYGSLVNNGLTIMQEFELQARSLSVDVTAANSLDVLIQFGENELDASRL